MTVDPSDEPTGDASVSPEEEVKDSADDDGISAISKPGGGLDPRLLNVSPDCIKIIRLDGRLKYLNKAGRIALNIEEAAVAGTQWVPLLPEQVHEDGYNALRDAGKGEHLRFTGMSEGGDAGLRYWDNMLTPLFDAAGRVEEILCVSRDVTEQRSDEIKLRTLLEELQLIWRGMCLVAPEGADAPMWMTNPGGVVDPERLLPFLRDAREGVVRGENGEVRPSFREIDGKAYPSPLNSADIKDARLVLTESEKECILWAGAGKTAWEIAVITGRSRRTVEFHLNNVVKKLNAANRIHAAVIVFGQHFT